MLHPEMKRALQEIAAHFGPKYKVHIKEEPDTYLLSILLAIKERLPEVSAMLDFTIQMGFFDNFVKEAQRLLGKTKSKHGQKAKKKPIKTR